MVHGSIFIGNDYNAFWIQNTRNKSKRRSRSVTNADVSSLRWSSKVILVCL